MIYRQDVDIKDERKRNLRKLNDYKKLVTKFTKEYDRLKSNGKNTKLIDDLFKFTDNYTKLTDTELLRTNSMYPRSVSIRSIAKYMTKKGIDVVNNKNINRFCRFIQNSKSYKILMKHTKSECELFFKLYGTPSHKCHPKQLEYYKKLYEVMNNEKLAEKFFSEICFNLARLQDYYIVNDCSDIFDAIDGCTVQWMNDVCAY